MSADAVARFLLYAAGAYGVVCLLAFVLQDRLIFFPRDVQVTPAGSHVAPLTLDRYSTVLRGWIVNAESEGPVVVYFGGNGEELSPLVDVFAELPATTVLMNYRGYGASDGTPAAAELIEDGRVIVETIARGGGGDRPVLLFGRSLGSGIAASVAARTPVDGIVLMSPFRSLEHMARRMTPWLPVRWLLRHRIDTQATLDALPNDVLVLYAPVDYVVPAEETEALLALFPREPQVANFGGGHNAPLTRPDLWRRVQAFVNRFAPAAAGPQGSPPPGPAR